MESKVFSLFGLFREKLIKSRSHDFGPGFLGSARHGAAGSWPVGHPGVGEGSAERPGASIITFHRRSPEKTRFECHRMPKRCRVPRDNILAALEEEELVADTQPELVSTNPADDLEVRASKRRKTADHYRSYLCSRPIAEGLAKPPPSPSCGGAVNYPDTHKNDFFLR